MWAIECGIDLLIESNRMIGLRRQCYASLSRTFADGRRPRGRRGLAHGVLVEGFGKKDAAAAGSARRRRVGAAALLRGLLLARLLPANAAEARAVGGRRRCLGAVVSGRVVALGWIGHQVSE